MFVPVVDENQVRQPLNAHKAFAKQGSAHTRPELGNTLLEEWRVLR